MSRLPRTVFSTSRSWRPFSVRSVSVCHVASIPIYPDGSIHINLSLNDTLQLVSASPLEPSIPVAVSSGVNTMDTSSSVNPVDTSSTVNPVDTSSTSFSLPLSIPLHYYYVVLDCSQSIFYESLQLELKANASHPLFCDVATHSLQYQPVNFTRYNGTQTQLSFQIPRDHPLRRIDGVLFLRFGIACSVCAGTLSVSREHDCKRPVVNSW